MRVNTLQNAENFLTFFVKSLDQYTISCCNIDSEKVWQAMGSYKSRNDP